MPNLLIINCFEEKHYQEDFNQSIRTILNHKTKIDTINATDINEDYSIDNYTHIIISGSHASAYEDKNWNKNTEQCIKKCISKGKIILGICYGHQFLVRTLAGKEFVRKSKTPEFGWSKVSFSSNPLFKNIENNVSMVSHYDEVFDLPKEFEIIAKSDKCQIHGFQYNHLPVWGIQFHPEYNEQTAANMFQTHFLKYPEDKNLFIEERDSNFNWNNLLTIFHNFISA